MKGAENTGCISRATWLKAELRAAAAGALGSIAFMHAYPADHRLLTDVQHPAHVVAGRFTVQARVLGAKPEVVRRCRINEGPWAPLQPRSEHWEALCAAPPQQFTLTVEATDESGNTDRDTIVVAAPGFASPHRVADGSDADAIGEWPERSLLGTRLGPNRNSKKWQGSQGSQGS